MTVSVMSCMTIMDTSHTVAHVRGAPLGLNVKQPAGLCIGAL